MNSHEMNANRMLPCSKGQHLGHVARLGAFSKPRTLHRGRSPGLLCVRAVVEAEKPSSPKPPVISIDNEADTSCSVVIVQCANRAGTIYSALLPLFSSLSFPLCSFSICLTSLVLKRKLRR